MFSSDPSSKAALYTDEWLSGETSSRSMVLSIGQNLGQLFTYLKSNATCFCVCVCVRCGTLNGSHSKECECVMEFLLIHFSVFISGLSGYVLRTSCEKTPKHELQ